jgi:spore photoproduct lyase
MIKKIQRKSMKITFSGRSSDYISPSFGFGCLLNCSYCYMKRHKSKGLDYSFNIEDILTAINNHAFFDTIEKPNQTHYKYITYDISCNEDFALHRKYYDWKKIFTFFKDHPIAMGTLATKIIPYDFLEFNPEKKIRIRFSLMPQKISSILEPNTPDIIDRIKAIDKFIDAGYDVHINFSPVVIYKDWLKDYKDLFKLVNDNVENKDIVLSEVIFLTHNKEKHKYNIINNIKGEDLLWKPDIQSDKLNSNGNDAIRYTPSIKKQFINQWVELHNEIIPWNKIRYVF